MSRSAVPSRSPVWPRVAVFALVGASVAGCADSARINSASHNRNASQAQQETTGSVGTRAAPTNRVQSQPLPAISRPETVASNGGYASGSSGLGAYRPSAPLSSDITGSVPAAPPKPAGHWTWDGGSPVTVGQGETVDTIARRHGVPASAIMQTNNIASPTAVRPGQRLVIPRYVSTSALPQAPAASHVAAAPAPAPVAAPRAAAADNVHVVQPGESLIAISRRYGVPLSTLAKTNNIQPYTKGAMGDRITIPGGARATQAQAQNQAQAPVRQAPAQLAAATAVMPPATQPRIGPPPVEKVQSVPAQTARMATEAPAADNVVKQAEATGSMPSFRWPVKGRIIAGFGASANGAQNDGINLAVPEGTPVKAAEDGVVAYAGNELKGYGNLVLIRHANGFVSAYANASELLVKRGDSVKRGQTIAHAGQTGNVTSPQLHFEIRKGSTPVDPTKYLGSI